MSRYIQALLLLMITMAGGCGNYRAERTYWKINQQHQNVILHPADASEKEFQLTVARMKKVIDENPAWDKSADIQLLIGQMYAARRDIDNAREELLKVVMNYSDHSELSAQAQFLIGALYEQRKEDGKALQQYNEIIGRYPETLIGMKMPLYIAQYYERNGMTDDSREAYLRAIRGYQSLVDMNPYSDNVTMINDFIVLAYLHLGQQDEALETLKRFVERYPKSKAAAMALYKMAHLYSSLYKQPEKAVAMYQRVINDYPDSTLEKDIRLEMGSMYATYGKLTEARKEFDSLMARYPRDVPLCAAAQMALASSYDRIGRTDEAIAVYQKIIAQFPRTTQAMYAYLIIADHYRASGNTAMARKTFEQAIDRYDAFLRSGADNDECAEVLELKATALTMQEKWDDALSTLETLRRQYPSNIRAPVALLKMAVIYETGKNDKARAEKTCNDFLTTYPSHELGYVAKTMLLRLQAANGKDVLNKETKL
jgi:TolA-binding protein